MDDEFELDDEGTKFFCSSKVMEAELAQSFPQINQCREDETGEGGEI